MEFEEEDGREDKFIPNKFVPNVIEDVDDNEDWGYWDSKEDHVAEVDDNREDSKEGETLDANKLKFVGAFVASPDATPWL